MNFNILKTLFYEGYSFKVKIGHTKLTITDIL